MFNNLKIGSKITLLLLSIVVLTITAVGYLAYNQSRMEVDRRYSNSFDVISTLKVAQVKGVFQRLTDNTDAFFQTIPLPGYVKEADRLVKSGALDQYDVLNGRLDSLLVPQADMFDHFNLIITNPKGDFVYQTNKKSGARIGYSYNIINNVIAEVGEGYYFGAPFKPRNSEKVKMFVARAIFDTDNSLAGFFIIEFNVSDNIYPLVQDTTGMGQTGEIILTLFEPSVSNPEDGLVRYISSQRKSDEALLSQVISLGDPNEIAVQKAATGAPKDFDAKDLDYKRVETLSFWNHIPMVGWGLVVKVDKSEMYASLNALVLNIVKVGGIVLLLSLLIAVIFSKYFSNPIISLHNKLNLVSQGILPNQIQLNTRDEIGQMGAAMNQLVSALKRTADFAKQIGAGNYDATFKPMSKDDSLGNALLTMRDSIKNADSKDKVRTWIVSGVAEVGQILRIHNNINKLGDEVIAYLTEKVGAIQGAFYVVENEQEGADSTYLEMKASYAYHKKKYLEGKFKLAEGLVGQAAAEKDIILRTEIPESYMSVTSGLLGEKKPTCLLLMPLITDEQVYGVLEFAGFEKFGSKEIEFIQEISVIIARTVFNIKVNDRTVKLLEESQQMSEELQYQQEILRQNAEEMEATQEELRRTNHRLEEQVREVSNTQKRMQLLLENASEVITIYEKDGTVRYISPSVKPILGYSTEELIGVNDLNNVETESKVTFTKFFERLANGERRLTTQYEYRLKDGRTVWLEATGTNFLSNEAIQGIVVNSRDITERRRAEQEERMRTQMQALSENSLDLITRVTKNGEFFYINPTIKRLTGHAPDHFLYKQIGETDLKPEIKESWQYLLEKVVENREKIATEIEFPSVDEDLVMQVNAIPEFNEQQSLESVLMVLHDITERKKAELEIYLNNKKITESINYAQRIQSAILPDNRVIRKHLPDSFIFYKPRDVVSGDFPWMMVKGDDVFIAAVDCTGHGVPGALISLIGYFILNDVVKMMGMVEPGKILDELNHGVTKALRQDDGEKQRDGMDISLTRINNNEGFIEYAGAHRPLYHLSGDTLEQIRGDKFPIGGEGYKNRTNFSNTRIPIVKGDRIFMFSDGLPDQFGGPHNRKYGPRKFRELIMKHKSVSMSQFYDALAEDFGSWKGENNQTDDVLVMGIKF